MRGDDDRQKNVCLRASKTMMRGLHRIAAVSAAAVVILGVSIASNHLPHASAGPSRSEPEAGRLSLVVLPLDNASGDPGQAYVAEALGQDLTRDLSRLPGSVVIAADSAAAIARRTGDPTQIGRDLDVRHLLRGTAEKTGERIHLALELVATATGKTVWAQRFDAPLGELTELRRAVAAAVAHQLGAKPVPNRPAEAAPAKASAQAVDQLLQAQALLQKPQTRDTMLQARRLLEAVLKADPRSVAAMRALASLHLVAALSGASGQPRLEAQEAAHYLESALAIDPHDAPTLALRGAMLRALDKPGEAAAAYRAAVAADPNFASAYAEIGRVALDLGETRAALAPIEKALRLSPLDPQRSLWWMFGGMALLHADEPKAAIDWLEKAVQVNPDLVAAQIWLAAAYQLAGEPQEARAAVRRALQTNPKLTLSRVERQLAAKNPKVARERQRIFASLKQAGLPP